MKDPLLNNLAERFADHAMDVDPGTWGAISGKLAVASGSSLSGLLQEKFAGHEAPVDPQVWTNISSQIGQGAAAGVGSTAGWWAAGIAATLVAGGLLFFSISDEPAAPGLAEQTQVVAPVAPEAQPLVSEPATGTVPIPEAPLTTETSATPATANTNAGQKGASRVGQAPPQEGPGTSGAETIEESEQLDPDHPKPTPEGKVVVKSALQDVVDNYVTSIVVLATEPDLPPPTQEEMPSKAVHPQHDEPEVVEDEPETPQIRVVAPEISVMIPTAFSPNGDGVNDELAVTVQNYEKATVRIFSASNNTLVFSADNLEAKWNGTVMNGGQLCEPGMYFYALEVTDGNHRSWSKGEVVRLFR